MRGVGVHRGGHLPLAQLVEDLGGLQRIVPLEVGEQDVAEGLVADRRRLVPVARLPLLEPSSNLLRLPHRLPVPFRELEVFAQVVERGRVGQPLDRMHPDGVAGEPGPPADAVAGEVGVVGVLVLRVVDVLPVAVEPILRRAARLGDVAEDRGVAHRVVSEGEPQEVHSAPALHRLGRRLLSVAVSVAQPSGEGMSCPRVEHAEEREALLRPVPVGIVLGDELQHGAELRGEVRVDHRKERAGVGEVAVVEMVVVEGFGIVARPLADESAPFRDIREEELFLARVPREPVLELRAEPVVRLLERLGVADLARGHHRERHLEKPLAAPVRVTAETAARGIVGKQLPEERFIVDALARRPLPVPRRRPVWKHAGEVVYYRKRVARGDALLPARRLPDKPVDALELRLRALQVVRLEALQRNGVRPPFPIPRSPNILRLDLPGRGKRRGLFVVLPLDLRGADDGRRVGRDLLQRRLVRREPDRHPRHVAPLPLPDAVGLVSNGNDHAAKRLAPGDFQVFAVLEGDLQSDAFRLDPRKGRPVRQRSLYNPFTAPRLPQLHLHVPVVPA